MQLDNGTRFNVEHGWDEYDLAHNIKGTFAGSIAHTIYDRNIIHSAAAVNHAGRFPHRPPALIHTTENVYFW